MDAYELIESAAHAPLALYAAALAFALLLEIARPLGPRGTHAYRETGNLSLGAINLALPYLFGWLGIAVLTVASAREGWGLLGVADWPRAVELALGMVLLDAGAYARHRLAHHVPLLWRIHRAHHSDPDVDATTALRNHPFELVYAILFTSGVVLLGGIGIIALLTYSVVAILVNIVSHARAHLPARIDSALAALIVTPRVHRMHHSAEQVETDSNFGTVLTLWDRFFGTYRAGTPERLGLAEFDRVEHSRPAALLLNPFARVSRETRLSPRAAARTPRSTPRA